MAIGKSKLHELFRKHRRISDLDAWLSTFDSGQIRKEILDWIRIDQLKNKKRDADGDVIGLYSYASERINPEKQEGTPFTLYNEGDFYKSMYMVILKDAVVFEADPIKGENNLFDLYTTRIIGLDSQNMGKLRELTKRKYIEYIKQILLGT